MAIGLPGEPVLYVTLSETGEELHRVAASHGWTLDGIDVYALDQERRADFRREYLGFVFQQLHLMPYLTALGNVMLPLAATRTAEAGQREVALAALDDVGLADKAGRLPRDLSGGEQQRVAIARALVSDPSLLVCDEPTGNLDPDTSVGIMQLLYRINRAGTTILMVTHDREMVDKMRKRVIALEDGRLARDERRGGYTSEPVEGP